MGRRLLPPQLCKTEAALTSSVNENACFLEATSAVPEPIRDYLGLDAQPFVLEQSSFRVRRIGGRRSNHLGEHTSSQIRNCQEILNATLFSIDRYGVHHELSELVRNIEPRHSCRELVSVFETVGVRNNLIIIGYPGDVHSFG